MKLLRALRKKYWPLIKSLQTGLLLTTGLAGYMSAGCPVLNFDEILALSGSLFLAISGSTVLNMWYDRDIDARMQRTCFRPIPAGKISPTNALLFGIGISVIGITWALVIDPLYGIVVFSGLFIDVVIYTVMLKRKTAWSIVWGGISGGMPILAGRALSLGTLDWVGVALALSILFWIPTHILTFNMRYLADYKQAGIPTFPSIYGLRFTRFTISLSSVLSAMSIAMAAYGIGMMYGFLRLMAVLTGGLILLAFASSLRPSEKVNFGLFKYASLYMFFTMLLIVFEVVI